MTIDPGGGTNRQKKMESPPSFLTTTQSFRVWSVFPETNFPDVSASPTIWGPGFPQARENPKISSSKQTAPQCLPLPLFPAPASLSYSFSGEHQNVPENSSLPETSGICSGNCPLPWNVLLTVRLMFLVSGRSIPCPCILGAHPTIALFVMCQEAAISFDFVM